MDTQPNPNLAGAPDGKPAGEGGQPDGGAQDTRTPEQVAAQNAALLADLKVERDRRKAAETALKDRETRDKLAAAKTAEDVERVRQEAATEIARERRMADLRVKATSAGVHNAFLAEAMKVDDNADVDAIVTQAAKAQAAFVAEAGKPKTITMGTGGQSPDGGGAKIWKASEVGRLTTAQWKLHEADILAAKDSGRYRAAE